MAVTLYIVRHAHRNKPKGSAFDNGLSPKGLKQAQQLTAYFKKNLGTNRVQIISSPKKRCIETVSPFAKLCKKEILVLTALSERRTRSSRETNTAFEKRIKKVMKQIATGSYGRTVILCSHGDWIPVAAKQLFKISLNLEKGGLIEVAFKRRTPKLLTLIQRF